MKPFSTFFSRKICSAQQIVKLLCKKKLCEKIIMIKQNTNMERCKIFRKTITWNSYLSIYNWIYLSIILLGLKSTTTAQNTSESPPLSIGQQQQQQLHADRLPNCTLVRPQFESRGINSDDIPKESLKCKSFLFHNFTLFPYLPLKCFIIRLDSRWFFFEKYLYR